MKYDFPLKSLLYKLHRAGFELGAVSLEDGETINLKGSRKERIERAHSIILETDRSVIVAQKNGEPAWVQLVFHGSPHEMVWDYSMHKNLKSVVDSHRAQWEKFYV